MTPAARSDESGAPQRPSWPLRLFRALRRLNSEQVDLWERWVRAQRPWEEQRWLHWVRGDDGALRLEGDVAPPNPGREPRP